jgi:hypothetical protein
LGSALISFAAELGADIVAEGIDHQATSTPWSPLACATAKTSTWAGRLPCQPRTISANLRRRGQAEPSSARFLFAASPGQRRYAPGRAEELSDYDQSWSRPRSCIDGNEGGAAAGGHVPRRPRNSDPPPSFEAAAVPVAEAESAPGLLTPTAGRRTRMAGHRIV